MRHFDMRNDTAAFQAEAMKLCDAFGADDFRDERDDEEPSLYDTKYHARRMMRFARLMQQADDMREHIGMLRIVRLLIWLNENMDETGSARYTANENRLNTLMA